MAESSFHDLTDRPDTAGYSDIVVADGFAFLAGKVAADAPDAIPLGGIEDETRACMELLGRALKLAGLDFEDVVRCNVYMTRLEEFERMDAVYRSYFPKGRMPARTTIGAAELVFGCRVEIDCVARIKH
ncbi:MAG: RidA family protein [Dongiaceae bacterium]